MSAAPSTERVLTFCILDCIVKIPLRIQRRWCMLRPTAAILENNNILYYSTRVHLCIHIKQYMLIRGCITDLVRFSDLQYLFLQNGFAFGLYHDCTVYHTRIAFVYMSFTAIFVPSVVLLALYGTSVGVVVNRHRKRNASIAPEPPGGTSTALGPPGGTSTALGPPGGTSTALGPPGGTSTALPTEQSVRRQRRSIRVATTCAMVTLLFLVCWIPIWVMAFLVMFEVVEVRLRFLHWAMSFTYFHPCVNPVVYFIVNDRFRSVFLHLVRRKSMDSLWM